MANKPPAAVPTHLGWAHEKTGEQLTSHRNLEPAEGTEDYQPNNRKRWAAKPENREKAIENARRAGELGASKISAKAKERFSDPEWKKNVHDASHQTEEYREAARQPLAHGREHLNRRSRISGRGAGRTSLGPMLQPT